MASQTDQNLDEINHLSRRIEALIGLINDQFTSMIDFCLALPLGGNELMEQMLRKLAILHTNNSFSSDLFKESYDSPVKQLTPKQALQFVIDIHINEKVVTKDWVSINGTEEEFLVSYSRTECIYNSHCEALLCNGFDCICVRRFFYEGIIKGITGKTYQSSILTPRMDEDLCKFSFIKTEEREDASEKMRSELAKTLDENIELREMVERRTSKLILQNQRLTDEIEERKLAEEKVLTLSQAIEQSPVSVILTDTQGNIEYVNSSFEKISGYQSEEVIGENVRMLNSGQTPASSYKELWDTITSGNGWQGEFQNRKKNGDIYWEKAYIAPVMGNSGGVQNYLAVKEDITVQKAQEEHILHQAYYDSLTCLPNRFLTIDRLTQLINDAERNDEQVALLFLDLDDFKKINDTLGHEVGDMILIEASKRLAGSLRSGDTVGRLGGDEFMVLLGGLSDVTAASHVAEHILAKFRDVLIVNNRELILTISIGISVYPNDGQDASELLRNADAAMYHSKQQGRNTYSYFTDAMNKEAQRRLILEEQMHGALDRNEFSLCYQPQVDIVSNDIIGLEALLRWHNPSLGSVSPLEFIPVAEHTGLIVPIGQFVLQEALSLSSKLSIPEDKSFTIAVNLSPLQFRDPGLIQFIGDTLEKNNLPGKRLELEITEGVLMNANTQITESMDALSKLGISIAMDDFGTGYSSLSYLRNYPFNVLKIDQSFIRNIAVNPADLELVIAIISMAHGLGLKVIAEGIETDDQLDLVSSHSCDAAQGYLFSKPLSEKEIINLLTTKR